MTVPSLALTLSLLLFFFSLGYAFVLQEASCRTHHTQLDALKANSERSDQISKSYELDELNSFEQVPVVDQRLTRRSVLGIILACFSTIHSATPTKAIAATGSEGAEGVQFFTLISDKVVSSLTYQKILGKGSYKTVYLVKSADDAKWALAVEKVRSKTDAKKGLHGIRVAEELQALLAKNGKSGDCFERVERWWFQSAALPEFEVNRQVFPSTTEQDRTQTIPHKFLSRSKWLVALKPVYDMDLRKLAEKAPTLYSIGSASSAKKASSRILAGIDLNDGDESALRLAYGMCEAGRLMHSFGLVHRDIKPKNVMLQGGAPVIIDFGFAKFVGKQRNGRMCIEEAGMKGESGYMLSADAAKYRGCTEGDTYAMGKTLYQVVFGSGAKQEGSSSSSSSSSSSDSSSSSSSSDSKMTVEKISAEETKFRTLLSSDRAGTKSRFLLTNNGRETLLLVIRGLCQKENPVSFEEASDYLKKHVRLDAAIA